MHYLTDTPIAIQKENHPASSISQLSRSIANWPSLSFESKLLMMSYIARDRETELMNCFRICFPWPWHNTIKQSIVKKRKLVNQWPDIMTNKLYHLHNYLTTHYVLHNWEVKSDFIFQGNWKGMREKRTGKWTRKTVRMQKEMKEKGKKRWQAQWRRKHKQKKEVKKKKKRERMFLILI
jgi:hypothetical protein